MVLSSTVFRCSTSCTHPLNSSTSEVQSLHTTVYKLPCFEKSLRQSKTSTVVRKRCCNVSLTFYSLYLRAVLNGELQLLAKQAANSSKSALSSCRAQKFCLTIEGIYRKWRKLFVSVPKKIVGRPFGVSESFWYRKNLCIGGRVSRFFVELFSPEYWKFLWNRAVVCEYFHASCLTTCMLNKIARGKVDNSVRHWQDIENTAREKIRLIS